MTSISIGVGVIGMGVMGTVHSRALIDASSRCGESQIQAKLVVCADQSHARAEAGAKQFGFNRYTTRWQDVVEANDVDLVFVCTSNNAHRKIASAAADNRKHVFCEKPVGRTPRETLDIREAVHISGVRSAAGYVYRWAPLVRYAREVIQSGRLGEITHYRGRFLTGYAKDPNGVLTWRFDPSQAGSGSLGGLMSHVIDQALFLVGPLAEVFSDMHTFITRRPLLPVSEREPNGLSSDRQFGDVGNEDYVSALARFSNGARGILQVCRVINGPACDFSFDISGSRGAVSWNFERMNELQVYLPEQGLEGYVRILSGPDHPGHERFVADTGMGLGFEDLAALQALAILEKAAGLSTDDEDVLPSFDDAVAVAAVGDAMQRSWSSEQWERVGIEGHVV